MLPIVAVQEKYAASYLELALCSEHTLVTNITIWAEVLLGVVLACAAAIRLNRLARFNGATEA